MRRDAHRRSAAALHGDARARVDSRPARENGQVLGPVVTWLPEEEAALRARAYPGATNNWVRDFYFRPNTLAYVEYGVLLVALIALTARVW